MSDLDLVQAGQLFNSSVGAITQQVANQRANRLSYEQEVKLMQLGNKFNVENWLMQAAYNSPSNQMMRIRNAGLNPNLVYGEGVTANMNNGVSGAPSGHAPQYKAVDFLALQQMNANLANLREQNALLRAQTEDVQQSARGKELENLRKVGNDPLGMGLGDKKLQEQAIRNQTYEADANQYNVLLRKAESEIKRIESVVAGEYGMSAASEDYQTKVLQNSILWIQSENLPQQIKAELRLKEEQANEIAAKIGEIHSIVALNRATEEQVRALTEKIERETDNAKKQGMILDLQRIQQILKNGKDAYDFIYSGLELQLKKIGFGAETINKFLTVPNVMGSMNPGLGNIIQYGVGKGLKGLP